MNQYSGVNTVHILQPALLILILPVAIFICKTFFTFIRKKIAKSRYPFDDRQINLFRAPFLLLIYFIILNILLYTSFRNTGFFPALLKITDLLIIFTGTLLITTLINVAAIYLQARFKLNNPGNPRAGKSLTQVRTIKTVAVTIVIILATGAALMTFEEARKVGTGVLISAGIMGIIVGFASKKSLGMILAGIQIALTRPIRLDDLVIIDGEFGRIEEIQLTYIVVQIWDERRMILPVTRFLDKPVQNITRSGSGTIGTISLSVDYNFPVDRLRSVLPELLERDKNWDGRTANVQVTDTTDNNKEVKITLSSESSSKNRDLRTSIQEKLIDYITVNHPGSSSCVRRKTTIKPEWVNNIN